MTDTSPVSPETEVKPVRWRTLRTPEGQRPSSRQQQRDARNRAEAWYQAIRGWETRTTSELVPRTSLGSGGAGRMTVIVGNYGRGQATLTYRRVYTPLGWLSESAVGAAISRQGGYLDRVRQGQGLSSLIHSNGRGWNGPDAKAYALEVLALAAELGDQQAIHQRDLLNVGETDTILVDSQE